MADGSKIEYLRSHQGIYEGLRQEVKETGKMPVVTPRMEERLKKELDEKYAECIAAVRLLSFFLSFLLPSFLLRLYQQSR